MTRWIRVGLSAALLMAFTTAACAEDTATARASTSGSTLAGSLGAFPGIGAPAHPKVSITWDRYYDTQGLADIERRLAAAHPSLCRLSSIGKSDGGRDMGCLTITDFATGSPERKAAFYIDGNIHSNEVQGSEVSLYTAWYLLESYGKVDWITRLLKERVFYIVPTINPDGRDNFFHSANNPNSPRAGMAPRDNDFDGSYGEDSAEDLDGDGNITSMRRADPNGRWKTSSEDPRILVACQPDERGQWTLLGSEGLDRDHDGRVAEEAGFQYDLNRTWGWNWQPRYIQGGADRYPFAFPESRAVRDFFEAHPNIAGAQTYHNAAGLMLRGPGDRNDVVQPEDASVYDFIGRRGESMLPGYKYAVIWKDLYTVYGGARPELATTVRALWSSTNLYLAYECPYTKLTQFEPPLASAERFDMKQKGVSLWDGDVVEAFIAGDPKNIKRYTEFEVAPTNEKLDLSLDGAKRDFAWSSGFETAVKVNKKTRVWTCEMRIPLKSLGEEKPKAGTQWRLNLYRGDKANKSGLAFSPTMTGTFHTPEKFGTLEFVE